MLAPQLNRVDFRDCHEGPPSPKSLEELVLDFLREPPAWVRAALRVRDGVVGRFGLKKSASSSSRALPTVGDRIGPFSVIRVSPAEILVGQDDRHLDFRVRFEKGKGLVVTTEVELHNRLGRAYFSLVRIGHAAVVKSMLRATAKECPPA